MGPPEYFNSVSSSLKTWLYWSFHVGNSESVSSSASIQQEGEVWRTERGALSYLVWPGSDLESLAVSQDPHPPQLPGWCHMLKGIVFPLNGDSIVV